MRLMLLLCVVFGFAAGAGAQSVTPSGTSSLTVVEPRAFGYFIGDKLERVFELGTGPGEELDLSSIPRPGPLNYWLELASSNVESEADGDGTLYKLTLVYQTFYAPLDPRKLTIPGFTLTIKNAQATREVQVRDFGFITSPIRQLFAAASQSSGSAVEVQPDAVAPRLVTGTERTALLISTATALLSLVGLAWHNAWWPFHKRPQRPFTDAARFIRSNAETLSGPRGYRAALLKLHRAFDLAAGRRVLADDVAQFLSEHPEFAPYGDEVRKLFASSRRAFFANEVEQARAQMPLPALAELSQHLSVAERRAA